MGRIIRYNGISIYYYPGDHNPPHLHVYAGDEEFTISLELRMIEGIALTSTINLVNKILDFNKDAIKAEIEKGNRGERMSVINNIKIK